MSNELKLWCSYFGIRFNRLSCKCRLIIINEMKQYYADNRPVTWMKAKYRAGIIN